MINMNYKQTTQVPNIILDKYLGNLTHSELKVLLYIIRKTFGYITRNKKRKTRDRISHSQFIEATGISRRSLPSTIQSLILKQLITVTDYQGNLLHTPDSRKGKLGIFYAPCTTTYAIRSNKVCKRKHKPRQIGLYNKTKEPKLKEQKGVLKKSDWERMEEILRSKKEQLNTFEY